MSSIDAVSCGVLSFGSVHLRLRTGGQLIAQVHQSKLGWVRIGACSAPGENRPSEEHAVTKLRLEGTEGKLVMTETS